MSFLPNCQYATANLTFYGGFVILIAMSWLGQQINTILRKVQHGDKTQVKVLWDATYNHMRGVVAPILRNDALIDEVLATTYERALQYVQSFDPKQDGYNWLCKIAQNTAYACLKEERKQHMADVSLSQTDGIERANMRMELEYLTQDLSEDELCMLEMRVLQNASFEEIGKKFGIERAGACKRYKKILAKIRKKCENEETNRPES